MPSTRRQSSSPVVLLAIALAGVAAASLLIARDGRRPAGGLGLSGAAAPEGDMSPRGRAASSPFAIPAAGWRDILLRVFRNVSEHRVLAIGAGVTFYAILALFPALAAFISLFGLFAEPSAVLSELQQWHGVLPAGGIEVIGDQVHRIASGSSRSLGTAFFIGLAVALWSANAGMKALFDALNIVYEEREKRGFLALNAVSLLFTIGAILVLLAATGAVVVLPIALNYVPAGTAEAVIRLGRWPAMFLVVAFALALLYRYGPSRENARWRWLSVGSLFAAGAWLAASMGFSWYAANFGSYNETYGSLGAIIGFMSWIWISVVVLLVGAQINAEAEHQTSCDSTTGGALPLGLRGARMADTIGAAQP